MFLHVVQSLPIQSATNAIHCNLQFCVVIQASHFFPSVIEQMVKSELIIIKLIENYCREGIVCGLEIFTLVICIGDSHFPLFPLIMLASQGV